MWKDIKGFDNYEVSTDGQVRNKKTGKVLKPRVNRGGYLSVVLYSNGKAISKYIHRLVAIAFIPNPENKPEVNHIDEDKTNNQVENLNWMTGKENINYGTRTERTQIPIYALYPDGTDEYFPSAHAAARVLDLYQGSIVNVLIGRAKTYHGLRFEYAEE